jgi:hypothetical protein
VDVWTCPHASNSGRGARRERRRRRLRAAGGGRIALAHESGDADQRGLSAAIVHDAGEQVRLVWPAANRVRARCILRPLPGAMPTRRFHVGRASPMCKMMFDRRQTPSYTRRR